MTPSPTPLDKKLDISLCDVCHCMTHTITEVRCGKCGGDKDTNVPISSPTPQDELSDRLSWCFYGMPFSKLPVGSTEWEDVTDAIEFTTHYGDQRAQKAREEAEIVGMERAKARVLRRTEIPSDAKNPTRDIVVIIGEECARIIDQDIAELNAKREKE